MAGGRREARPSSRSGRRRDLHLRRPEQDPRPHERDLAQAKRHRRTRTTNGQTPRSGEITRRDRPTCNRPSQPRRGCREKRAFRPLRTPEAGQAATSSRRTACGSSTMTGAPVSRSSSISVGRSARMTGTRKCSSSSRRVTASSLTIDAARPVSQVGEGNDMDHHAADAAGVCENLDLRDAIRTGQSTGGGEAARYVARRGADRVAKLVLLSVVPPIMRARRPIPAACRPSCSTGSASGSPSTDRSSTARSRAARSTGSIAKASRSRK